MVKMDRLDCFSLKEYVAGLCQCVRVASLGLWVGVTGLSCWARLAGLPCRAGDTRLSQWKR